jgi:hypothetical protein
MSCRRPRPARWRYLQEEYVAARMLDELQADLRARSCRPAPARRADIPKADGSKRPLGIPALHDRVAQQAPNYVMLPTQLAGVSRRQARTRAARLSPAQASWGL